MEIQGKLPDNKGGGISTVKLDTVANMMTTNSSALYEQAVLAGKVYSASNQTATAWSVALNATHTGLVVSNPAGSGKNLIILKASFALSVAPAGIATIGLFTGYSSAGLTAHTTPLTPNNCLVGDASGIAKADAAADLPGTPVWHLQMMGGFTAAALPSTSPSVIDVGGTIIVKPGGYVGIGALTAVTGFGTIIWQEKDV